MGDAVNVIEFPRQCGLQYPIQKTPGPWLVVGLAMMVPTYIPPSAARRCIKRFDDATSALAVRLPWFLRVKWLSLIGALRRRTFGGAVVPSENVHSLDIHYDGDDPNFKFENADDWPELDAKMIEDYNRPHRKAQRLALRRATEWNSEYRKLFDAADRAKAHMELARQRRANPGKSVYVVYVGGAVGFVPAMANA